MRIDISKIENREPDPGLLVGIAKYEMRTGRTVPGFVHDLARGDVRAVLRKAFEKPEKPVAKAVAEAPVSDVEKVVSAIKAGGYTRASLYARMEEIAESRRQVGQTSAQAFAKFMDTIEGRELYQLQKSLPGGDGAVETPVRKARAQVSDFDGLVAGLMRLSDLSYSKAVNVALATAEGAELFRQARRVEKINSGFTARDLAADDLIESQRQAQRDLHKAEPSAFDAEVAKTLQRNPQLTRSAAIDHVLTTPIGKCAWEAEKARHAEAVAKAMRTDVVGEQPGNEKDDAEAERTDAAAAFGRITDNLQRQHQCSRSEAMARALNTREGQAAFARWKGAAA
jgi:hypothetical protein